MEEGPESSAVDAEVNSELDVDADDLFDEVRRNSRKALVATAAGFITGLGAAAVAFYAIVHVLEPRSIIDLRLLFGSTMAGLFVGGAVRKAMLPSSMREEGELDMATLPAGTGAALIADLGSQFTLARKMSMLDLVGLGSRGLARYDLLAGGALVGMVRETGSPVGPVLLGGERALTMIVTDVQERAMHVTKTMFGSELQLLAADGRQLGTIRRSRVPFIRTLVIEAEGTTLRLSKKWFSKAYAIRAAAEVVAEVRSAEERDDMGILSVRQHVTLQRPDLTLPVLAGALAMDAI